MAERADPLVGVLAKFVERNLAVRAGRFHRRPLGFVAHVDDDGVRLRVERGTAPLAAAIELRQDRLFLQRRGCEEGRGKNLLELPFGVFLGWVFGCLYDTVADKSLDEAKGLVESAVKIDCSDQGFKTIGKAAYLYFLSLVMFFALRIFVVFLRMC